MKQLNIRTLLLWVLNIYLVGCIILLGVFIYQNRHSYLQNRAIESKVAEMKEEYGQDKIEKTGVEGSVQFTAFYPKSGNRPDPSVVQIVEKDAHKVEIGDKGTDPKSYIFYVQSKAESPLANTKWVVIEKQEYKVNASGLDKAIVTNLDHYYTTEDGQRLRLTSLFTDPGAAKTVFIDQIRQALEFKQLDQDAIDEVMQEMTDSDMADWTFNYIDSHFIIHLPQSVEDIATVDVSLTSLSDQIDTSYLKGKDLENMKKKEEKKTDKVVALTFDDGPSPETTPKALEILKKHKIKATFFMMGSHAAENPDLVKRVSKEGHEVANHTWSHPNLQTLDTSSALQEIDSTTETLKKLTGKDVTLFRPPYGNYTQAIQQSEPLSIIMWSVDTLDWKSHNPDAILQEVKNQVTPGGIILMHDIHQTTIDSLEQVIDYLEGEGYKIVPVGELLKDQGPQAHTVYYSRE